MNFSVRPLVVVSFFALFFACSANEAEKPRVSPSVSPNASKKVAEPPPPPLLDYIELDVRPDGGVAQTALPLVIALHGLGDRPENLEDLFRDIAVPCRLVLPRAPIPWESGSSWFDIKIPYKPDPSLAPRINVAADRVAELIEDLVKKGHVRGKPIITGFSQGGMISFAVAVRHPELIAAAVPLSGALPQEAWPKAPVAGVKPIVRAFHGAMDDLIRVDYARLTVKALKDAGYDATLIGYPGLAHAISDDMRRDSLIAITTAMAQTAGK